MFSTALPCSTRPAFEANPWLSPRLGLWYPHTRQSGRLQFSNSMLPTMYTAAHPHLIDQSFREYFTVEIENRWSTKQKLSEWEQSLRYEYI
jgi:hypothetical protein